MKISEVTQGIIKSFCKIDDDDDDDLILLVFKPAAENYIKKFTGYKLDLDTCEDFTFAYLVLINEMVNNRSAIVSEDKLNKILDNILGMYSMNLL